MRFIKQLGICEWVFPGATHNRFFHSIGTAYLSWEMIRGLQSRQPELQITNRDLTCVTLAGCRKPKLALAQTKATESVSAL